MAKATDDPSDEETTSVHVHGVPKTLKQRTARTADAHGKSMSGFIRDLLDESTISAELLDDVDQQIREGSK